ncbi:glycosyltransferase family A protein [Halobacteriovorax sp. HLS]|uniref:glycosyltransferase family 2 protein n=1 Tax=Halobacteriovorax sp. HLS TaxID=2234000 RepID=UPI000FD6BE07|nr:glycosyltransferase family A protein [Halobacteriovorax sp. HLS]
MKVTVVIPTYKRYDYLERLLLSIERQTYKGFEVIVVDDCSPAQDEYQKVIEKFSNSFEKITYLSNEKNSGAPHSRNRGIRLARGEFIALVDDDDEWFETKLEKQLEVFEKGDQSLGLVYTWADVVDENKVKIGENRESVAGDGRRSIVDRCFVCSPSVMLRKSSLIEAGLFDEEFPSCQDWDMWTRILFNGNTCDVVKEPLVYYYKHGGETIGKSPRALVGFKKYYAKHFIKLIRYLKLRHLVRFARYLIMVKS